MKELSMKSLVIIPTYNEIENIQAIIPMILKMAPQVNILVVDDNSPDLTWAEVEKMRVLDSRIHLLKRAGKEGLGKAYLAGFAWGLQHQYEALIEMDADFSHRPEDLLQILENLKTHDFVVGSRWIKGGQTQNWGLGRIAISRGGSVYSRLILGFPLRDWTGGFNGWKAETLKGMELDTIRSNGYSFQIELKYRALKKGFKGVETPILFADRRVGQSKMSSKIVFEALYRVWGLRF